MLSFWGIRTPTGDPGAISGHSGSVRGRRYYATGALDATGVLCKGMASGRLQVTLGRRIFVPDTVKNTKTSDLIFT